MLDLHLKRTYLLDKSVEMCHASSAILFQEKLVRPFPGIKENKRERKIEMERDIYRECETKVSQCCTIAFRPCSKFKECKVRNVSLCEKENKRG